MLVFLSYIFNLIQTISACILLDEYFQKNYPELREKYKNDVINHSYNAIYFYSKIEIIFNKHKPYIHKIIENYPILKNIVAYNNIDCDVEFIMDGKVVYKTTKAKMLKLNNNSEYNGDFDFIIYSENTQINDNQNSIMNRKIIKNIDIKEESFFCEKSEIKFVLCEFSIGDKKFKVDFKNARTNYYVVNNVFDVKFLKYFLQKYYYENIKDIDLNLVHEFKINIIDHNIDTVISNKDNIVKLFKDKYELIKIE